MKLNFSKKFDIQEVRVPISVETLARFDGDPSYMVDCMDDLMSPAVEQLPGLVKLSIVSDRSVPETGLCLRAEYDVKTIDSEKVVLWVRDIAFQPARQSPLSGK